MSVQNDLPTLGLIIHNEANSLPLWLSHYQSKLAFLFSELLVIDNASTDSSLQILELWRRNNPEIRCRIKARTKNQMGEARNMVLREATTSWVYFTDADCEVDSEKLKTLFGFRMQDPQMSALGGGNLPPRDDFSFVGMGLRELSENFWAHLGSLQAAPPKDKKLVSHIPSCHLLINREAALSVGGFDERCDRAGEDMSLSHRLRRAGYQMLVLPGIEILHRQNRGLKAWLQKMLCYGEAQIELAVLYPRHFLGFRGLQFLALPFLLATLLMGEQSVLFSIFVLYLVLLFWGRRQAPLRERAAGISFVILTHGFYALGEMRGLLRMLVRRPHKMPALETPAKKITPGKSSFEGQEMSRVLTSDPSPDLPSATP